MARVPGRRHFGIAGCVVFALCLGISGCAELPKDAAIGNRATSAPFPQDKLIGKWGIASYRIEKDRNRTEAQAKAQCKLPYVIAKGPTDGILMHVADDPQLHELKLKGAAGGKAYLGFEGPPADAQDREIVSFSDNLIIMRFIDPEVHKRYGIFVYVRCPD